MKSCKAKLAAEPTPQSKPDRGRPMIQEVIDIAALRRDLRSLPMDFLSPLEQRHAERAREATAVGAAVHFDRRAPQRTVKLYGGRRLRRLPAPADRLPCAQQHRPPRVRDGTPWEEHHARVDVSAIGQGMIHGLGFGVHAVGLDGAALELTLALEIALRLDAEQRWLAGEAVFAPAHVPVWSPDGQM